ncbi:hypothetical protein [Salinirubrum litoreum]|uniref:ABC-2 type transport system permease protein n=1 Tax=Salinirubrum litoreum TaxID=1126234 RepID=A0ABD5RAZ7_9EURY|nr:hypothetical protein [Salinirubrum litoreum]
MALPSPRRTRLVARTELRRRVRALRDDPRQLVALGIGGLFLGLFALVVVGGAFFAGQAAARGAIPSGAARTVAAFAVGIPALTALFRGGQKLHRPDGADSLLTAAPTRDVVAGLLVAEFASGSGLFAVPFVLAGLLFALGAGSVVGAVLVPATLLTATVVGTVAGFAAALAVLLVVSRSEFLQRFKTWIAVLAMLAYFGVLFGGSADSALGPVFVVLGASPIGWFADLALVGTTPGADSLRAAGAAIGSAVVLVGSLGASIRLAGRLWFESPARPEEATASASAMNRSPLARLPVSRPTRRIAHKSWLRARRAPITLIYAVYPIFVLYAPVAEAVSTGSVPAYLPTTLALYVAWGVGAAFTLNPLGDEGSVLPVTLTTPVSGRQFVAGHALTGVAVGVPLALLAVVVGAVFAGLSPATAVAVVCLAVVLPVAATGLAVGVGTLFPKFETSSIGRGREAVVPSLLAFGGYSLALVVLGLPGLLGSFAGVAGTLAGLLGTTSALVTVAGAVTTAVLLSVAGGVGAWYAIREFESYTVA